jgi:hypothetical protein
MKWAEKNVGNKISSITIKLIYYDVINKLKLIHSNHIISINSLNWTDNQKKHILYINLLQYWTIVKYF